METHTTPNADAPIPGTASRRPWWLPARTPRTVPPGEPYRVMLVCSTGGHLAQLMRLSPWWSQHDRSWACFQKPDAEHLLEGERVAWCYHPTTRNLRNFLRNLVLSVRVLRRERPDVIISTGAGVAVPFFWVGRLLGAHTVYLEVYDRIDSATMTGKLCRPVTELFLVQWPEQQHLYRDTITAGPVY